MSADDRIELLKDIYADWGRGDYSRGEFLHPAFELVFAPGFLEEGSYTGRLEAWRAWKQWLDQWQSWHYEPVRYIELDDDRIAVFIEMRGVGRTTGVKLPGAAANLWEFDGGLVRRLVLYMHRGDMVRELGLESS